MRFFRFLTKMSSGFRITGIAEIINNKKALYDRSKAISGNGSIPAQRLEGMIDV